MSALHTVLAKFDAPKKTGGQYLVRCPAHEDRVASLAIREGDSGKVLVHCHAGCATEDILRALGLEDVELFDDDLSTSKSSKILKTYNYPDANGVVVYQVVRFEPKDFRQRRPDGKGDWLWNLQGVERVVYRLNELQGKAGVLICEGEKDVDRCWELGLPATTNAGGAGKWTPEYSKQLVAAGVKRVVILPDADVPGRSHANDVAASLLAVGIAVRMGILPDVPPKGDLTDYLTTHSKADLIAFLKTVPEWTPEAEPAPAPPQPLTTFRHTEEGRYEWTVMPPGVMFSLDRVRRDHHELCGELTVRTDISGTSRTQGGALMTAEFNLSSARARSERAKLLAQRAKTGNDVDWFSMLEEFCERVFDAERTGTPAIRLDEGDPPIVSADEVARIFGFSVLMKHAQILFGDGGAAKSYFALVVAGRLAMMGHRVLYADWELLAHEHRLRLSRLFGADRPGIWYLSCERPLVAEQDRLLKTIRANNINFLIVDSIAVACDGPPESAEVATAYFRALRTFGIGSLNLAHTNRSEQSDRKPFGSAFWHNLARATWYAERADENEEPDHVTVGLFNRKANLGPLAPATGVTLRFVGNRTEVSGTDIRDKEEFAGQIPLWQRIRAVLESGPMTTAALASELQAKENSVATTVRRHTQVFNRMTSSDGIQRICLVVKP